MLIEKYQALRQQYEHNHNWSAVHIAYHQICTALQSPDPKQAIQARLKQAQERLADREGDDRCKGYCTHYRTLITLFSPVLQEMECEQ